MTGVLGFYLKSDHSRNVYLMSAGNFSLDSEWELFLGSPR